MAVCSEALQWLAFWQHTPGRPLQLARTAEEHAVVSVAQSFGSQHVQDHNIESL